MHKMRPAFAVLVLATAALAGKVKVQFYGEGV